MPIQTDCFAYNNITNGCNVLNCMNCETQKCSFYKSKELYEQEQIMYKSKEDEYKIKLQRKTADFFLDEIELISNEILKRIIIDVLNASPKCIQTIPASSSRKYHPDFACTEGGLIKHIKAAVGIAKSLMRANTFRDMTIHDNNELTISMDAAIAAIIIHDCEKPDDTPQHKTLFNHPILAADLFKSKAEKYINEETSEYLNIIIPLVYNCVASHMGKWTTAEYAKDIVLPEPKTGLEQFVHLCDYLASRKFLEYNFLRAD